jgi:hypothetical protein
VSDIIIEVRIATLKEAIALVNDVGRGYGDLPRVACRDIAQRLGAIVDTLAAGREDTPTT